MMQMQSLLSADRRSFGQNDNKRRANARARSDQLGPDQAEPRGSSTARALAARRWLMRLQKEVVVW